MMPDGSRKAEPRGLEKAKIADAKWRPLHLPHDWGVEGPFRDDLEANTGKLPWKGIGWYRKHFKIASSDKGKRIFVDFDGAMANARIWLNGQYVGTWPYGYNSFRMELTEQVVFGSDNLLAVRLDTENWDSRWYPGAGIYRHVWLVKTAPVHVSHWGVQVTTPEITGKSGEVRISANIANQSDDEARVSAEAAIFELDGNDKPGRKVAEAEAPPLEIVRQGNSTFTLSAKVSNPRRWDLTSPSRYLARVTVKADGRTVDAYDTPFGFRTLEFTGREGFKLNGRRVNLNGTCNHHDLGALGSALNERALERQLEKLQEMGCNALRTSHNPPAPELLDFADKMGFVVQVEAFDCWQKGKCPRDYNRIFKEWHRKDLEAMVRRDRNHPSVIMWSIGNEIYEQDDPPLAKYLRDLVHAEDPTRPVTVGCNNGDALFNGFEHSVDVAGINYNLDRYRSFLACHDHQQLPIHGSETSSSISSRGEYFFPVKHGKEAEINQHVSSYDIHGPGWACPPDEQFGMLDRFPAFLGEFVWTGWDYLGEPTPYNRDATILLNTQDPEQRKRMMKELEALGCRPGMPRSSYFGIIDLAGFPKDRFYSYQSRWRPDLPMAHIFPHWNWPERIGQITPVHLYTSGDEAELFLNGKSLGKKQKDKFAYRLKWDEVRYEPGELKAVAYKNGRKWATDMVRTTGVPAAIKLSVDRAKIAGDGRDLAFVTARIVDSDGLTVPRSDNMIRFKAEGAGRIVATDNGDQTSYTPFASTRRKAFNGLCLAIVSGTRNGTMLLKAASAGLQGGETQVLVSKSHS
jgi:beta-galactosidase